MKIQYSTCRGSALLVSMVILGIVGVAAASYLKLVSNQRLSMARSVTWNVALPTAEAGVEEAFSHLNNGSYKPSASNGWTQVGRFLTRTRTSGEDSWSVCITTSLPPVVVAQGFTRAPLSTNRVSRVVRVKTQFGSNYPNGLATVGTIDLKGNSVTADSYDSTDPTASTGGQYVAAKRRANGSVASDTSIINVGNANIWGTVATGPTGSISIGPNGSVGDAAWHNGGNTGIQAGASRNDMNMAFPDVQIPTGCVGAFAPSPGTVNGTNYTYVLGDGFYRMAATDVLGGKVIVTGHAIVLVTGGVNFSGSDFIYIEPGKSLDLYVAAPSATFSGQGIANSSGVPADFSYYGLPTNTSLTFTGNTQAAMAIYAPSADLKIGGGGSDTLDLSGAVVAKTATLNGHANFHYDESLGRNKFQGWIANSWDEIGTSVDYIVQNGIDPNTL